MAQCLIQDFMDSVNQDLWENPILQDLADFFLSFQDLALVKIAVTSIEEYLDHSDRFGLLNFASYEAWYEAEELDVLWVIQAMHLSWLLKEAI